MDRKTEGFGWGSCLQLEAWFDESYEAYRREKEHAGLSPFAGTEDYEDYDDEMEVDDKHDEQVQQQAVRTFRLVLKSKMIDPLTLSVTADTVVATLVSAFREKWHVGPGKAVSLFWDGDKLDESTAIGDTELEDEDAVEVRIS